MVLSEKKDILIIEDSPAVAILLEEFLKKLSYSSIHTCNNGKLGIQVFGELVKSGKVPIVLLDYALPDMNGDEVMDEIFALRPDAKVIIETASDKAEETIKSIFRAGAHEFLEKPIRFENLKNIIQVLEEEEKILGGPALEKADSSQHKIDTLLDSSTRISLARIAEHTKMKKEDVLEHLKQLQSSGKVTVVDDIKEISCNICDSVKIGQTFHCPSCNSSNFKRSKLIEHYKCGNFSEEEYYKNNVCPKCRKEIKVLGVDYKIFENYYICNDCGNKFPEPAILYLCLRCNNRFKIDEAKWITSEGYKAINL